MAGFDDFLGALIGQESGGNYGAVNARTGALGYSQILPSNVGPWSQQYLGRTITPSQFLNSPALQRQLTEAVLKAQYDKYGAAGAASWWYSGSASNVGSTRSSFGEPSVSQYVQQVLGRMGEGTGYTAPTSVTDNRVQDTPVDDLLGEQSTEKLDALSGADRNGLGLKQVDGQGLEAALGGAGVAATQGPASAAPQTGAQRQSVGETFAAHYAAADQMQSAAAEGLRGAVIDLAKQYIGTPYVWGGSAPGGFDCSGLIQYAMAQAGINMPRVSWDQLAMGQRTDVANLQPGDLVGFGDGGHIAMYLGGGQILEAPRTGLDVRVRGLGKGEDAWGVSLADLYK